jgi:O-antigen/teichoic acid export membrane protein
MSPTAIERSKRLLSRAQATVATVYGVLGAGWGVAAGPVTMILIARRFTPQVQGYYYTFSGVLALNILVELGFSNIVKYFAGCEWARLSLDQDGRLVGDPHAYSRLVSLGRVSYRWYFVAGLLVAFGIGKAGDVFFSASADTGIRWMAPWIALSILSGINLTMVPVWALLEGCGQVNQVYRFRTVTSVLSTLATWASISLGFELWTAPVSIIVVLAWSAVFLSWHYRRFLRSFFSRPAGACVDWWGEIWQVQWRIAISYLSSYFAFYIFTPILFHFHGPVAAGRFGMSLGLVAALANVATMWSTPRGPQFAVMIARREYDALDQLLYRIVAVTAGVLLLGGIALWLLVYGLNVLHHPFAVRLLPPLPTALLVLGMIASTVHHPMLVYLRAHKKEPYVIISIVSGILIGASSFVLGRQYGAIGVALSYMVSHLVLLPWFVYIFFRRRDEWHYGSIEPGLDAVGR